MKHRPNSGTDDNCSAAKSSAAAQRWVCPVTKQALHQASAAQFALVLPYAQDQIDVLADNTPTFFWLTRNERRAYCVFGEVPYFTEEFCVLLPKGLTTQ